MFKAFFDGFNSRILNPGERAEGGAQVAVVNADGSGFREITTGPDNSAFPSMSPDGVRFVYRSFGASGDDGLKIGNLTTGAVTTLTQRLRQLPPLVAARRSDHVLAPHRWELRDLDDQA